MAIKNLGKVVPQKGIDYFTEEDINSLNIPKKTSDLTNDSSYATETYVNNKIAKIQLNGDIVNANEKGLFSWKHDDITTDYEYMAKLCDYLGLTEVYQTFKWNGLDSEVATGIEYLKNNTKNNVEVAYLCGEASWYNTTDAKAHIDKIIAYNNGVGINAKITKILLDVEPWTLSLETSEWLNDYVNMITTTHTYANNNNLTFGLVIPFWVDTADKINNETVYKTIIDNCDEVYVMNYNRNTYDDAIDNEVAYCKLANKPIYSIAETQAPNEENGVTDNLTYYNVGLDELNDNWQELKDKYNYSNLNFAYHDYRAMKILIPTIPSGGGSGLTTNERNTLIEIINAIGVFNVANGQELIDNFNNAWSGGGTATPEPTYYSITRNLNNAISTSSISTIKEGSLHTETITANNGYLIDSVIVAMGGVDVTSTVYSNGIININSVTGNLIITATTSKEEVETPTNGVAQTGSTLAIVSDVIVTQNNSNLIIE